MNLTFLTKCVLDLFGGYTKVHEIAFKAKNVELSGEVLTFDKFESQFRADFT